MTDWRGTRYDKLADNFLAMIQLASMRRWRLRQPGPAGFDHERLRRRNRGTGGTDLIDNAEVSLPLFRCYRVAMIAALVADEFEMRIVGVQGIRIAQPG
jgi:hypothetical protein